MNPQNIVPQSFPKAEPLKSDWIAILFGVLSLLISCGLLSSFLLKDSQISIIETTIPVMQPALELANGRYYIFSAAIICFFVYARRMQKLNGERKIKSHPNIFIH